MKKEILIERVFQVWAIGITCVAITGIVFAIVQLATGNISNTSAFAF